MVNPPGTGDDLGVPGGAVAHRHGAGFGQRTRRDGDACSREGGGENKRNESNRLQLLDGAGHRVAGRLRLFDDDADLSPVHLIGQRAAHHLQRPLHHGHVHLHQLALYSVHFLQDETRLHEHQLCHN
ncbi:hypothetical protein EYF80_028794 [Liparis tanakae]|uniref:Uncharacterized protein n=1 Tax=Liparis tanakae TaxID=230148 RepID=A0A4Z2H5L9_9TELE|nr:hypothetical protein EYF80_028794 [Liparis tanakae]